MTGDEVEAVYIMKGYKVDTDTYLEVFKDELENVAPVSTRTIEIDEFVPRKEIGDSLKGNRKAACPANPQRKLPGQNARRKERLVRP